MRSAGAQQERSVGAQIIRSAGAQQERSAGAQIIRSAGAQQERSMGAHKDRRAGAQKDTMRPGWSTGEDKRIQGEETRIQGEDKRIQGEDKRIQGKETRIQGEYTGMQRYKDEGKGLDANVVKERKMEDLNEDIEEEDEKSHLSAPGHVGKLQRSAELLKGVIKKKETKEEVR
jgi:hypothetical protein